VLGFYGSPDFSGITLLHPDHLARFIVGIIALLDLNAIYTLYAAVGGVAFAPEMWGRPAAIGSVGCYTEDKPRHIQPRFACSLDQRLAPCYHNAASDPAYRLR
jgi:hypothetical protein